MYRFDDGVSLFVTVIVASRHSNGSIRRDIRRLLYGSMLGSAVTGLHTQNVRVVVAFCIYGTKQRVSCGVPE